MPHNPNKISKNIPKNILWLPTGGQIGDATMTLSAFAEVSERQDVHIFYIARRNASLIADLARAYPRVTVVSVQRGLWGNVRALFTSLRRRYDAVIVQPYPKTHAWYMTYLKRFFRVLGTRVIGFGMTENVGIWKPYTTAVKYDNNQRNIDNVRHSLQAAGLQTKELGSAPHMRFVAPRSETSVTQPYIMLHPFSFLPRKTLPLGRWRSIIEALRKKYPDHNVVITGSVDNQKDAERLSEGISGVLLEIQRPILEVVELIKNAAVYLGVDTGLSHIAGVLSVPTVVIVRQGDPTWSVSYNPNATILSEKRRCLCGIPGEVCEVIEDGQAYYRCVYDVTDEAILGALAEKLSTVPHRVY